MVKDTVTKIKATKIKDPLNYRYFLLNVVIYNWVDFAWQYHIFVIFFIFITYAAQLIQINIDKKIP